MNQENNQGFQLKAKQDEPAQLSDSNTEIVSQNSIMKDEKNEVKFEHKIPNDIKLCMPPSLSRIVSYISDIVQAHEDSIATNLLTTLTPLTAKTRLLDSLEDEHGSPIILYTGFFAKSGGGKTGVMRKLQYYLLGWLEALYNEEQKK